MNTTHKSGKLSGKLCEQSFLTQHGALRPEVLIGPGYGIDVSVIALPGGLGMALTSDPLSLIPTLGLQESAWLSVHLMANDMATTGHCPMYAQVVLNLPVTLSDYDYQTYWEYFHQYCQNIGVAITGGHSGKTEGQNSTIAGGGTMITVAPLDELLTSNKAQSGDLLIVAGEAAISSTAILAMSFPEYVKNKTGTELWQQACALFYQTSSLKAALSAVGNTTQEVTAMHDVTEGGVMGAIFEMAVASGNGVIINRDAIPVGLAQQAVTSAFGLDPYYSIGAGATIISVKEKSAPNVLDRLHQAGIKAAVAGKFTPLSDGRQIIENDKKIPLVIPDTDPYWNAFYKAAREGKNK
jgi:hydrogenase expression/formation protein HypE